MGKKRSSGEQPRESKTVNNLLFLNLFELIQDISEIIKVLYWVFTTESLGERITEDTKCGCQDEIWKNDAASTVQHKEFCSGLYGSLNGRSDWGEWIHVYAWLNPFAVYLKPS